MPQTQIGAMKTAAKLAGLSYQEFSNRINSGLRKCTKCKEWKKADRFCRDRSRTDGVGKTCFACRRVLIRKITKGRESTFKGKQHTPAAKNAMSNAKRGKRFRLGIKHTVDSRVKMSQSSRITAKCGVENPNYKDGKTHERRDLRFTKEYARWRFDVFARDGFTCQCCMDTRGGNLCAHHIKPFADFPDLRFEIENGVTLCENCHKAIHRLL